MDDKLTWRFFAIFPLVIVGACAMLLMDTLQQVVYAVRKALFDSLVAVIKWGANDQSQSDAPKDIASPSDYGIR